MDTQFEHTKLTIISVAALLTFAASFGAVSHGASAVDAWQHGPAFHASAWSVKVVSYYEP